MANKIENQGNAHPQKHDAMTVRGDQAAKETERPLNYRRDEHAADTHPASKSNTVRG
jgi:hypothetical protein